MSNIADVVAQLLAVVERLDQAAVTASRTEAEIAVAHAAFTQAGAGSDHAEIRRAISESEAAAEKAAKVARKLSTAASHLSAYINVIAPGAAPARSSSPESMPSGEQLLGQSDRAASSFRRLSKRVVQNAESAGETAKKLTDFLNAARPQGTSATTARPEPPPQATPAVAPGDAAQALIITGAAVVAAALNAANMRKKRKEQERDRSKQLPRPDPGTGQG
ncbi:hypothetical protein [Micromonospora sp. NBC_01796]|uniref:hypothetical protein n=1 Tax=Micromonospora sp. NBC_01796 TaxID=2975987 RepID=UPI002DDA8C29|nr:hypothetical protein [Micromonospora sp. NBC_01796]WSA87856.1 hypothetical protein OIE47_09765 [Micromonospora sp. NBC_01796]